jgi:hypothetical protein
MTAVLELLEQGAGLRDEVDDRRRALRRLFGLRVLERRVQDLEFNFTTFLAGGRP